PAGAVGQVPPRGEPGGEPPVTPAPAASRPGVDRIAVFTANLGFSVRRSIAELRAAFPDIAILIVEHAPPRPPLRRLLRNQRRNLGKHGWRWIPHLLGDAVRRLSPSRALATAGVPGAEFALSSLKRDPGITHRQVADINGPEACAEVRAFRPQLGISLAAPILKRQLFELPELGTINVHKGKVPEYR